MIYRNKYTVWGLILAAGCLLGAALAPLFSERAVGQKIIATPAIEHQAGDDCIMLRDRSQEPNQLGFIAVNSQSFHHIELIQEKNGVLSEKRIYTMVTTIGDSDNGCSIFCFSGSPEYGCLSGNISVSRTPPQLQKADRMICARCLEEIRKPDLSGDILLVDLAGKQYYDICAAGYSFTIRERYEVTTKKEREKIDLLIRDLKVDEVVAQNRQRDVG